MANTTTGTVELTPAQQRELERYQTDRVLTAPPQVLISMLLERALADLEAAQAEDELVARSALIRHAQDIVLELRCSLDLSQGEIAANLDALYEFVDSRCMDAFLGRTVEPLVGAHRVLADIHEGWQGIL